MLNNKILIVPRLNQKQYRFCKARKRYIAYGGARGGGKSFVVRWKAIMLCYRFPGIKVMITRRSYPELEANHIGQLKEILQGIATYNKQDKKFTFPNGSVILMRYAANEDDLLNYQGTEVDILFIDEATQITYEMFVKMTAFVRGVNDFPKRIYLTCNPGGKGHAWVKRLFIDRKYLPEENPDDYEFIKALVHDNKALLETDPHYLKTLEALPPKLRKAWLEGSWDIYEGQFFEEFINNEEGYKTRLHTHVISPFMIPDSWTIYRSFDYGYAKPFSCGWWAVDYDGRLYRIAELYGCNGTPNEGLKWTPSEIFQEIKKKEQTDPYLKGKTIIGVADPSIWDASRGISVADTAAQLGIYFSPGDNKRIAGWQQMHERMKFDENGYPMMYVFTCCKDFIRTIPLLIYDEHKPEDLDTEGEDHIADETRYMCMMRPIKPVEQTEHKPIGEDPLNQRSGKKYGYY